MTDLTGPEARAILESWQRAGAVNIRPGVQTCQACGMPLKEVRRIHVFHVEGDLMGIVGGVLFECSECPKRYYIDETTAI